MTDFTELEVGIIIDALEVYAVRAEWETRDEVLAVKTQLEQSLRNGASVLLQSNPVIIAKAMALLKKERPRMAEKVDAISRKFVTMLDRMRG